MKVRITFTMDDGEFIASNRPLKDSYQDILEENFSEFDVKDVVVESAETIQ